MKLHSIFTIAILILISVVAVSSCGKFDPVGTYQGDATVSHEIMVAKTKLQSDGSREVQTTRSNGTQNKVHVSVHRDGEDRLELVASNGCKVLLEQDPAPNEHNASVLLSPTQNCTFNVDGYNGPTVMGGTVQFEREGNKGINITLTGTIPINEPVKVGDVSGRWSYTFNGTRQ